MSEDGGFDKFFELNTVQVPTRGEELVFRALMQVLSKLLALRPAKAPWYPLTYPPIVHAIGAPELIALGDMVVWLSGPKRGIILSERFTPEFPDTLTAFTQPSMELPETSACETLSTMIPATLPFLIEFPTISADEALLTRIPTGLPKISFGETP